MASEITVRGSLYIKKGNKTYQSQPQSFTADLAATIAKGPVPGAIAVSVLGTNVDLSELVNPSWCFISNPDTANTIEVGIWNGVDFYPMLDVGPGQGYPVRLSDNLFEEYHETGTGTTGAAINTLRLRARPAAGVAVIEAFEK